ncbi:hypothetical protein VW29_14775 [Devosia limi DSM 17137]|uniref:Uncharacterized protein n=1 Tax=Devosia limi DSM 17137 TaxID=1121477 RepID=A0A0F5LMC9_9HYPH|nr:hypothetical protein [Devosia limi]KKB82822.1 hypothetical protein VW29_14775 [Devosia limi DSM 17137]
MADWPVGRFPADKSKLSEPRIVGRLRFVQALVWASRSRDIYDGLEWTQTVLAAALAHLGRIDEARDALRVVTAARPGLTIGELFGRNQRPGPHDGFLVEGLVKAGILRT